MVKMGDTMELTGVVVGVGDDGRAIVHVPLDEDIGAIVSEAEDAEEAARYDEHLRGECLNGASSLAQSRGGDGSLSDIARQIVFVAGEFYAFLKGAPGPEAASATIHQFPAK